MEHTNGRYRVVWAQPEEDAYHSITSYTNGRANLFIHTRSYSKALELFENQCALVNSYAQQRGE